MSQDNGRNVMVQGRIVWTVGNLFKGEIAKQYGTQNPKLNKQGQSYQEYGFGLAVPKSVLSQMGPGQPGEIWAAIHEEAYKLFPSRQIPPAFHMKVIDGDTGLLKDGTPVNTKKGYPGHMVFTCKTNAAPIKFFRFENGQNFQINEGIKCGDYVNVQLNIKSHSGTNAGLYLNPNAVQFLGFGEEIISAPSGDQIFGTMAPPVPQGASMTPIAQPGMIVPQGVPPMQNTFAPPQMQQTVPQQAPIPHYGILPQAHQPAQTPAYQPPTGTTQAMPGIPMPR